VNNRFRKTLSGALIAALTLLPALQANAVSAPQACARGGYDVAFFNGPMSSPNEATYALANLRAQLGTTTPTGAHIRYETFYHPTPGLDDFVTTFAQRLDSVEQGVLSNRFELFDEAIRGDGPMLNALKAAAPATANALSGVASDYAAFLVNSTASLLDSVPALDPTSDQATRIAALANDGGKLLFFAHSQGAVYANQAYSYATTKVSPQSVGVVYAAPVTTTLNGAYTLADDDQVISALGKVHATPSVTDSIPDFVNRAAGANGKKDVLGHGLLEVYLNASLATSTSLHQQLSKAMGSLLSATALTAAGFFEASLTWDGPGDVDLHVAEPSHPDVFPNNPVGGSGVLDVNNSAGYGPEHYYAACNSAAIEPGTYAFSVANNQGADGRKVTLQVSSKDGGVLATAHATLGGATGWNPSIQLVKLNVTQDSSGQLHVSIAQ
jgi:hypothetical protein